MLEPRGIRNNNPGNIRKNSIHWQGAQEIPFDPVFVEFTEPVYGLRALMRILLTYYKRHNLNSVQSIVNRWAPPHENATDHYAGYVARSLKVKRTDHLIVSSLDILTCLARAIVLYENGHPPKNIGKDWYLDKVYKEAADMALN